MNENKIKEMWDDWFKEENIKKWKKMKIPKNPFKYYKPNEDFKEEQEWFNEKGEKENEI